ncbi:MAG: diadenylate cyclase CdaA [Armatimonadota bacterium]
MNFLQAWQKDLANVGWTILLSTVLDIFLVAAVLYWLIMLSKRTRAWKIIWGLLTFLLLVFLTERLQLHTLNYLLRSFLPLGPVAIVILFYPELRHALENMGQLAGWGTRFALLEREDTSSLIPVVVRAACRMSERQIGALIVIMREDGLDDIAATGTRLDAAVSEELLLSIFTPGGPLHDGAVLIRGNRVVAAGCILPLSESTQVGHMIHTRHKAALGVAEESDAAVVVVSEETGTISLALDGKLHRGLNEESLTRWLKNISGISEERPERSRFARKVGGTLRKAGLRR